MRRIDDRKGSPAAALPLRAATSLGMPGECNFDPGLYPFRAVKRSLTALARTSVLPKATLVGPLSALGLNRSRGRGGKRAASARG